MHIRLGTKVGLLLALPLLGSALSAASFELWRERTAFVLPEVSISGRQRKVAEEFVAYARMVGSGQDDDRQGLRELVVSFDQTMAAFAHGGRAGEVELPAPRPEFREAVDAGEEEWRQWKQRLLSISDLPATAPAAREAQAWLGDRRGALGDRVEAIRTSLQEWARNEQRRQSLALLGIFGLNVALFIAGLWLMHRSVVRPVRAIAEATRRVKAGDYSHRVDLRSSDEMGELGAAFNEMSSEVARMLDDEARFQEVIEHAADAIVIAGAGGLVTHMNVAAERMFGWQRSELHGKPVSLLFAESRRAAVSEVFGRPVARGEGADLAPHAQTEGLRQAGSTFPTDVSISLYVGRADPMYTCSFRDGTERAQLAAKMMQMDRMIAVGTLAAGVAHEINNPLTYVVANLRFIAEEMGGLKDDLQRCRPAIAAALETECPERAMVPARLVEIDNVLSEAREGAERVRIIVRDLKTFSRADEESRGPVDVSGVVESAAKMAANEIRHRARLVKELPVLPRVLANEARLGQVFLNLLVNAAQAIPEGAADSNEIRVRAFTEGASVVTEVRDTGSGIPTENLARIFDPFFTTKPIGQGTGLGLAICQGIVRDLGGEIQVQTKVGQGTTFRVVLPQAPKDGEVASEPKPELAPRPALLRRGRVLVVDDDLAICSALKRALSSENEVTQAGGGRAALDLLQGGNAFDVILCDLMMPELTGMELHEELLLRQPEQARKMVFITGGTFTPWARQFLDRVPNQRVEKPFDTQAVRTIVRDCVRLAAGGA